MEERTLWIIIGICYFFVLVLLILNEIIFRKEYRCLLKAKEERQAKIDSEKEEIMRFLQMFKKIEGEKDVS